MAALRRALVMASVLAFVVLPVRAATGELRPTKGVLLAIDTRTGHERWRTATAGSFTVEDVSRDTIAGRAFPCDSTSVRMVAFDASDGQQRWRRPPRREDDPFVRGGETLPTGSTRSGVVLSATDRRVAGLDASTGEMRWSLPTSSSAFVTANGTTVVSATTEGSYPNTTAVVRGLNRATGKKLWYVEDRDLKGAPVTLADETSAVAMFRSSDERSIHTRVLDPRSGRTRWETDGGETYPAGSVVVLSTASRQVPLSLRVFDARTGEELWSRPGAAAITPLGERLALVDDTGLTIVDARTGDVRWTRPGRLGVVGDARSIAVVEGRTVTLLDTRTGSPRLSPISLPDRYETVETIAVAGDTLYVGLGCVARD
jgi:outer membrane protein assembly factor BamB